MPSDYVSESVQIKIPINDWFYKSSIKFKHITEGWVINYEQYFLVDNDKRTNYKLLIDELIEVYGIDNRFMFTIRDNGDIVA